MSRTYFFPYQNPTYPDDADKPIEEIEALARAASLARAQSPNPLTCALEGVWSVDDPMHTHTFQECMAYRHANVIADGDPWTFWQLLDAPPLPPKQPIPPLPIGIHDWQFRALAGEAISGAPLPPMPPPKPGPGPGPGPAQVWGIRAQANGPVDPTGATPPAFFQRSAGWNGFTINIQFDPSIIFPLVAAQATRITLEGQFTVSSCYAGTIDPNDSTAATKMHQFTFGGTTDDAGNFTPGGTTAVAGMDDSGVFIPLVTDPLPVGFDCTNGLWVSLFLDSAGNGVVAGSQETFINVWYQQGDFAGATDKASDPAFTYYGPADLAVLMIEGLYDPKLRVPPAAPPATNGTTPPAGARHGRQPERMAGAHNRGAHRPSGLVLPARGIRYPRYDHGRLHGR
jgi:hypothetical protein